MSDPMKNVPRRPVILIILDGFGLNPAKANNAVAIASTPNFDRYFSTYSHTSIQASGLAVGLPDGQMGNSEVGHMTIGSGCVVRQDLVLIDEAISDRSFFENRALVAAANAAASAGRPIHLMGLVSDGGVHSHVRHLNALIKLCKHQGARPMVHMFTDGRDTAPRSAQNYLKSVESALEVAGGRIATVSGRYYAMDRDNRWERTELAWRALVDGEGRRAESARAAIETAYAEGEDDEFIRPTIIEGGDLIQDGDPVIHFNFRKDRPRQLVSAFFKPDFDAFDRRGITGVKVTCMMEYDQWFGLPFAFDHDMPKITLGQILSDDGLPQFHCAETEKYAHVTFFFNGGRDDPFPGEERTLIPSPKVATYDLKPEMSAGEVADAVVDAIERQSYPFIVVNFANGDMVGHTAIRDAVIAAVETLDREAGRVMDAAVEAGYSVILTADHGNCDEMVDPVTGEPHTQHSVYPVPCLIVDEVPWRLSVGGGIKDIAPTVLNLMGIPVPDAMDGRSLLLGPATV
ncbi:2,3-bisphosphoglycerate-independent phosphoglycerate mutase [Thiorhodococcus mannitoliphagus]|uniref:2,3-bisphosphoglycerate-independent phosphoglycerate mutase n=1 Tax=Thiorhodococcus mannitoliphagus TaxID=329406 RepID=A0A6P1DZQ4_9GAMM|nr:2,3-bisphosphoglycerate-independent phosphoglycerate mutase [Thiorhodococcus mannitoliphagus]NEX22236.1 2,3-bisphosphoglycerate-independent phosphoglycerate mutase [Thiorhodococcus mannitoliphagus]